jgi:hypothetical protein
VVETFQQPRLIPKHLTGSEAPNCESSASRFSLDGEHALFPYGNILVSSKPKDSKYSRTVTLC